MMIYNVTGEILQQALDATNRVFDGNIRFKRIEQKGKTREGVTMNTNESMRILKREIAAGSAELMLKREGL